MSADERAILKNNIKSINRLMTEPSNRERCYSELRNSIDSYIAGQSQSKSCELIANKFILRLLRDKYDDWFKTYDTDGLVDGVMKEESAFNNYVQSLESAVAPQHYNDILFDETFKRLLQANAEPESKGVQASIANEILTSDTDIGMYVEAVVERLKAVFESTFQLDSSIGLLMDRGIVYAAIEGGQLKPKIKASTLLPSIYSSVITALEPQSLNLCPQMVRLSPERLDKGYTYYPAEVLAYTKRLVGRKGYNSWPAFESALREELWKRFEEFNTKGILAPYADRLVSSLSTLIMVLTFEARVGIHFRVSAPGSRFNIDRFKSAIKSYTALSNSEILINPLGSTSDAYDIQIMQDIKAYLSKVSWGYEAFESAVRNGVKPSLLSGLPIGRKLSGEIVTYKLDPSDRFLNFIAAGSGAGKGVLTLSILAAAIGDGIPVFYTDYKPDMAEVFWDLADKYGVKTYSFDGSRGDSPYGWNAAEGIPDEVYSEFSGIASTLVYLKSLEWALILAKYRASRGTKESPVLFIFDEVEVAQANVASLIDLLNRIKSDSAHKPKNKDDLGSEAYQYAMKLGAWISNLDIGLKDLINATGRKSSVITMFIGQSTLMENWRSVKFNGVEIGMFNKVLRAGTVFKFLGKGTTGPYGSDKAGLTSAERTYINNHRFFLQGKGASVTQAEVFKTFLTLNSDNPEDKCWRNGIAQDFYNKYGDDVDAVGRELAKRYPGGRNTSNEYGMHIGTGFEGLIKMYCDHDESKIRDTLSKSWEYSTEMLNTLGMSEVYESIGDFLYDFSELGLCGVNDAAGDYPRYLEAFRAKEEEQADTEFSLDGDFMLDGIEFDDMPSTGAEGEDFMIDTQDTTFPDMDWDDISDIGTDIEDIDLSSDTDDFYNSDTDTVEDSDWLNSDDEFSFDFDDSPEFSLDTPVDEIPSDSTLDIIAADMADMDSKIKAFGDSLKSFGDDLNDLDQDEEIDGFDFTASDDETEDILDDTEGVDLDDFDVDDFDTFSAPIADETPREHSEGIQLTPEDQADDEQSAEAKQSPDAIQTQLLEVIRRQQDMYAQLLESQQKQAEQLDRYQEMFNQVLEELTELKKARG